MNRTLVLVALAILGSLAARSAPAQIRQGEFGFVLAGSLGSAGDACWGFDCTPRPAGVLRGETVSLTVRAPFLAPYVVLASPAATSCVALPGIGNSLVLDPPRITVFAGFVDQRSTMRFCYDGFAVLPLTVPLAVPLGLRVAFQAVAQIGTAQNPQGFAFASAILADVR